MLQTNLQNCSKVRWCWVKTISYRDNVSFNASLVQGLGYSKTHLPYPQRQPGHESSGIRAEESKIGQAMIGPHSQKQKQTVLILRSLLLHVYCGIFRARENLYQGMARKQLVPSRGIVAAVFTLTNLYFLKKKKKNLKQKLKPRKVEGHNCKNS